MKLILDTENSYPTTLTVKGKEITLLLIESSILIDSSQIAKLFDKKEKTVATKVQKSKLEKYETENIKLLKNYGLMNPDAVKPRPFYDLRQPYFSANFAGIVNSKLVVPYLPLTFTTSVII